jgi:6-pyruvoyltetrahydropterin/6-carboxytetrahydropterin synthase
MRVSRINFALVTPMPRVTATRRLLFNAAHRLFNPAFSDTENEVTFGKCNNPNWHGHNYTLEVSVEGEIDEATGYVLDLSKLRDIVEREIVDRVDHKNFNLDVEFMQGIIPTAENIVVQFWKILEPAVAPAKLTKLMLRETENNHVEYTGR